MSEHKGSYSKINQVRDGLKYQSKFAQERIKIEEKSTIPKEAPLLQIRNLENNLKKIVDVNVSHDVSHDVSPENCKLFKIKEREEK